MLLFKKNFFNIFGVFFLILNCLNYFCISFAYISKKKPSSPLTSIKTYSTNTYLLLLLLLFVIFTTYLLYLFAVVKLLSCFYFPLFSLSKCFVFSFTFFCFKLNLYIQLDLYINMCKWNILSR